MKILIVLAHPDPSSLNHSLANEIIIRLRSNGHSIVFHDLYKEEFDPILTTSELKDDYRPEGLLLEHCRDLSEAEGLLIIHPNWRDQPPAILKGWIDRVFRAGVAFRYEGKDGEEGHPVGMLKAETALIINTSDCPPAVEAQLGDPLQRLWEDCILKSCGIKKVSRRNFTEVILSSQRTRINWIEEACELSEKIFRYNSYIF